MRPLILENQKCLFRVIGVKKALNMFMWCLLLGRLIAHKWAVVHTAVSIISPLLFWCGAVGASQGFDPSSVFYALCFHSFAIYRILFRNSSTPMFWLQPRLHKGLVFLMHYWKILTLLKHLKGCRIKLNRKAFLTSHIWVCLMSTVLEREGDAVKFSVA